MKAWVNPLFVKYPLESISHRQKDFWAHQKEGPYHNTKSLPSTCKRDVDPLIALEPFYMLIEYLPSP